MDGSYHEAAIDKAIREAQERGAFDNLPGKGKPLAGLDEPDDENWWLKRYLEREKIPSDVLLPPGVLLRKEIEQLPTTVRSMPDESAVRAAVAALNERVVAYHRVPEGPMIPVRLVDADTTVASWRAARGPVRRPPATATEPEPQGPATRRRWWQRRTAR